MYYDQAHYSMSMEEMQMIELTVSSGKKVMVNPDKIIMIMSNDTGNTKSKIYMSEVNAINVMEDILDIVKMIAEVKSNG